ncbi:short-chain dehydrogenase [Paraphoma chrysanthemicola]|nr:short-chain dehydrogenase [Paraphoma chrysanthemicola]
MGQKFSSFWDQSFFIDSPTFTDKHLPDQTGKVHIITGGYAGIGYHLSRRLYAKNATLYLIGRSSSKASAAIQRLKGECPSSTGRIEYIYLDLADLTTIKPAVDQFVTLEKRLDVLVNNAAIMVPPSGSKSVQGYDLQTATNVYGPFLFTVLLHPLLAHTARTAETGTVRLVWCASHAPDLFGPPGGVTFVPNTVDVEVRGMNMDMIKEDFKGGPSYAQSKAADIILATETARRWGEEGIISTSLNPGNLRTELVRDRSWFEKLVAGWLNHPAEMGAWTELYAGWSPEITPKMNGCYVIPWGRVGRYNEELEKAVHGGKGDKLWTVCEQIVGRYT